MGDDRVTGSTGGPGLTIESIVAISPPGEFRVHPRDRVVAYTDETAGARQLFTTRSAGRHPPTQVTASDKPVSDPRWSPDGRRLAFVRDGEIWIVESDGSRLTRVVAKPAGGRAPRWSPDGRSPRLPVAPPRLDARSGSSTHPSPAAVGPGAIRDRPSATGRHADRDRRGQDVAWSPDGPDSRSRPSRRTDDLRPPAGHDRRRRRGRRARSSPGAVSATPAPAGCRTARCCSSSTPTAGSRSSGRSADGRDRLVLTGGEREHGEPSDG